MDEKDVALDNQKATADDETVAISKGRFSQFLESLFGGTDTKAALADDDKANPDSKKDTEGKKKDEPKRFDEKSFQELLSAEKAKWEDEQAEKNRLNTLPAEEKAKAEMDSYKQQLAEKDRLLAERKLKDDAIAYLSKEGYPVELAGILNFSSEKAKEESLSILTSTFESSLTMAIKQRLKGKTPAGLGGAASSENAIADAIARNIRGGLN